MTKTQTRAPATQVEVVEPSTLQAIQRAEIDSTIATAKRFPRNMERALEGVKHMATLTETIAEECHYSLPKKDKNGRKINIQGPSVRFSEILASQWGNLRIASRVIDIGSKQVVAQGVCLDLETNVAYDIESRRSIVSKDGRRYSEDVVVSNANAIAAVARRNAVLDAIPRPLWWPIYELTLKKIGGGNTPLTELWQRAVAWFGSRGVQEPTLRAAIELSKPSEITQEQIQRLRGWRNAIEQDGSAIEEIFGDEVQGATEMPAREPPTEVAPGQAEESKDEPPPDSKEMKQAKTRLLKELKDMRQSLSEKEMNEARDSGGVGLIDSRCTLAQLEAVLRKASEIAEGGRE